MWRLLYLVALFLAAERMIAIWPTRPMFVGAKIAARVGLIVIGLYVALLEYAYQ